MYHLDSKKLCLELAMSRIALWRILARSDIVFGVSVSGVSIVV